MARDAVDEAVRSMDVLVPASVTDRVPLVGADGFKAMWNRRHRLAAGAGVHVARVEHLLNRFGSLATEVLDLIADDPSLGEPLPGADDYLRAEVVYAVTHEAARHLEDVLTRRTRISIEAWDRGVSSAPVVAELMAPLLGWSEVQRENEIAHYLKRVEAERLSQEQPDDATADVARLGVADIIPVK
jgi:glycerol-3-phosphate dehydrogenase